MPLFPPVTDTLRWDDLVRQGRAMLPQVAPEWTDQNPSDPGIAILELLAWLVEAGSYRVAAVTDRDRRLMLGLAGFPTVPARPARCLVHVTSSLPVVPRGLLVVGVRGDASVPLALVDDVAVRGARVAAVASAVVAAEADDYRTGCTELSRELGAARPVQPFGPDPVPGDAVVVGLGGSSAGLAPGPIDLWWVSADGYPAPERPASSGHHHSVRTEWDAWNGAAWVRLPAADVRDDTTALTRSGRVRLALPDAVPAVTLGDQETGALAERTCAWLRCRIVSGRHDAAPVLSAVYVDVGEAIAAHPYAGDSALPDGAVLGEATGVPGETLSLPHPWCGAPPRLWLEAADGTREPVRAVDDLAAAGSAEYAAVVEPDRTTVRFGDGLRGATLPRGATVLATGEWTTSAGLGEVRPPLGVVVPVDAGSTHVELVASLAPGQEAEDVEQTAARADAALWVHDRITEAVRRRGATSLDDLPLDTVRTLGRPERAVTLLDLERCALATPGTSLRRARALPEVDPRLPGLRADGCVTVVLVPTLPVEQPRPSAGLLRRVRAELELRRTLATRVFVVGPDYVGVGVRARLRPSPGSPIAVVVGDATRAVRDFLHPISGGPHGHGWPFGRTVRRSEVLQVLDAVPGVDRVEGLTLVRELVDGPSCLACGDLTLRPTELVVAATIDLVCEEGEPR